MHAITRSFILAVCIFVLLASAPGALRAQPDADARSDEAIEALLDRARDLRDSRPADAARLAEQALSRLDVQSADTQSVLRALVLASRSNTRLGKYQRALEQGMRANRIANRSVDVSPALRADMHDALGLTYQRLGSMGDALLEFRKAHDIRDAEGDNQGLVTSLTNIAGVHALSGQYVEALEHYETALTTSLEYGRETTTARIRTNIAFSYIERGAAEQALPHLEKVLAYGTAENNALFLTHGNQNMGEALFYLGRLDDAEDHFRIARDTARDNGLLSVLSDSEIFLGRIALARGAHDTALELARAALENTRNLEEPQRLEDIHDLMYRATRALGDMEGALAHLEESIHFRELVFNRESDRRLSLINAQFGLTEKQHEIDLLRQEREIQALQLERQRHESKLVLGSLLASGVVILGLGLGLSSKIRSNREIQTKSQQLEEAKQQLAQASEAKSELLATTSHEIRTPLNGILGMTDLLLATELTPSQMQQLEAIRESGQAMAVLLEDILDMSKIEAGRIDMRPADVDLHAFLHRQLSVWRSLSAAKGLGFDLDLAPDLPRYLHIDVNRLRQILLNLVSNAVKFTEEGQVRVAAALDAEGRGLYQLKFTVTDTGPGLSAEDRERIFQPYQGSHGLAGSAGLGLHICRKLVHWLGGEIGVDSDDGAGSRFWFTVAVPPAREGMLPLDPPAAMTGSKQSNGDPAALAGKHLMIVDDNEINRRLFAAILTSTGMTWEAVESGRAAVDKAAAGGYDLILMDLRMPGMDGIMATRLIREMDGENARVPILAVTADTGDDEAAAAISAGMNGVIAKPIKPDCLIAKIAEILGQNQHVDSSVTAARS